MILHKRPSNLLLDNLLSSCKALIIGTPQKPKQPEETNWEQEFHPPRNENICLHIITRKACANESRVKLAWDMPSAAKVRQEANEREFSFSIILLCASEGTKCGMIKPYCHYNNLVGKRH